LNLIESLSAKNFREKHWEKFLKLPWIDFYQDYLLATNPSSKVKLFRILSPLLDSKDKLALNSTLSSKEKYEYRIKEAEEHFDAHLIFLYWTEFFFAIAHIIFISIEDSQVIHFPFIIFNILLNTYWNIYPMAVQMKIRARLEKVLDKKRSKKKVTN